MSRRQLFILILMLTAIACCTALAIAQWCTGDRAGAIRFAKEALAGICTVLIVVLVFVDLEDSRYTYHALQELKRHRASMARLEVWIAARDRFTGASEALAPLNLNSKYRRPDDAPEVLAYHAAELDLARAADELYAAERIRP